MFSQIEITINLNGLVKQTLYHSNTQKQKDESFSNFANLFLSSLPIICISFGQPKKIN